MTGLHLKSHIRFVAKLGCRSIYNNQCGRFAKFRLTVGSADQMGFKILSLQSQSFVSNVFRDTFYFHIVELYNEKVVTKIKIGPSTAQLPCVSLGCQRFGLCPLITPLKMK